MSSKMRKRHKFTICLQIILLAMTVCAEDCEFDESLGTYHEDLNLGLGTQYIPYKPFEVSWGTKSGPVAWKVFPSNPGTGDCPALDDLETDVVVEPGQIWSQPNVKIYLADGDSTTCGKLGDPWTRYWCIHIHWASTSPATGGWDQPVLAVFMTRHKTTRRIYRMKQHLFGVSGMTSSPAHLASLQEGACTQILSTLTGITVPMTAVDQPSNYVYNAMVDPAEVYYDLNVFTESYTDNPYSYNDIFSGMCSNQDLLPHKTNYRLEIEDTTNTWIDTWGNSRVCFQLHQAVNTLQIRAFYQADCYGIQYVNYRLCHGSVCSNPALFTWSKCDTVLVWLDETKKMWNVFDQGSTQGLSAGDPFYMDAAQTGDRTQFEVRVDYLANVDALCGALVYTETVTSPTSSFDISHVSFDATTRKFTFDAAARSTSLPELQDVVLSIEVRQANYQTASDKVLTHTFYVREYDCVKDAVISQLYRDEGVESAGTSLTTLFPQFENSGFVFGIAPSTTLASLCLIDYIVTVKDPSGYEIVWQNLPSATNFNMLSQDAGNTASIFYGLRDTSTQMVTWISSYLYFNYPNLALLVGTFEVSVEYRFNSVLVTEPTKQFVTMDFIVEEACDSEHMLKVLQPSICTDVNGGYFQQLSLDASTVPAFSFYLTTDSAVTLTTFNQETFKGIGYFVDLCGVLVIEVSFAGDSSFWGYDDSTRTFSFQSFSSWPAVDQTTHQSTLDFNVKTYYTAYSLNFKETTFQIVAYDCSVIFDATQDVPFTLFADYESTATITLAYHDNVPDYCKTQQIRLETINGDPFANFGSFLTKDPASSIIFNVNTAGQTFSTAIYSGSIEKESSFGSLWTDIMTFHLTICQFVQPASTYKSGLAEQNSIDLSDLPASAEKLIELSSYRLNDDSCGWIDFDVSVVHSNDPSFDPANVVLIEDKATQVFDLRFENLSRENYPLGEITVTITLDVDQYDHSAVGPLFTVTVPLFIVDCIVEGQTMSVAGHEGFTVEEFRFGTSAFTRDLLFTETYTFTGLSNQAFCPTNSFRITCQDPDLDHYRVLDSTVEISDSYRCGKFIYNALVSAVTSHSLQAVETNFPADLESGDPLVPDQAYFQGDYVITIEAVHPSGESYQGGSWQFSIKIFVDCYAVTIASPGAQTFEITPPVFYNGGVEYSDTTLHYWLRSTKEYPITGFMNEYSYSCSMVVEMHEVGYNVPDQTVLNAHWVYTFLLGTNLMVLDTTFDPPVLRLSSDRNVHQSYLSTALIEVVGSLVCVTGMEGCTLGRVLTRTVTPPSGPSYTESISVRTEFYFTPHQDCSNEGQENILIYPETIVDFTMKIGDPSQYWNAFIPIYVNPVYLNQQGYSPTFVHLVSNLAADGRVDICHDGFSVVVETNAQTQSDLFGDMIFRWPNHFDYFTVTSAIRNSDVVNKDGCDLAQYETHPVSCQIWYKVNLKILLTDVNGVETLTTIATQASGTITYVSECLYMGAWLTVHSSSYWHLSTSDQTQFDSTLRYGYNVNPFAEPASFDLPYIEPALPSGDKLIETCGPIVYTITPQFDVDLYPGIELIPEEPGVYQSGRVDVFTTKQYYALGGDGDTGVAPYETFYDWHITGRMQQAEYTTLFYFDYQTSGFAPVSLKMYDHCYAMTLDGSPDYKQLKDQYEEINFNITKDFHYDSSDQDVKKWHYVSQPWTYSVHKHVKAEVSGLKMYNLNYTRPYQSFDPDPLLSYQINQGCGDLTYTISYQSWDWDGDFLFVKPIGTFDQVDGTKLWQIYGAEDFQVGNHEVRIKVEGALVNITNVKTLTFDLEILDCYVREFSSPAQNFKDITLDIDYGYIFDFQNFTQVPECDYEIQYYVTFIKQSYQSKQIGLYDFKQRGYSPQSDFGVIQSEKLIFSPPDSSIQGTTWTVYVAAEIYTNTTFQAHLHAVTEPFQLTVQAPAFMLENTPPKIDSIQSSVKVYAGLAKDYLIGVPYDMQDDLFTMTEWQFKGVPEDSEPAWVTLVEDGELKDGVFFHMSPLEEDINFTATIAFTLTDQNDNPKSKEFSFQITVVAQEVDAELPTQGFEPAQGTKKQSIIGVSVSQPDTDGYMEISFSKYISLPRNCTEWTESNEGAQRINITYVPTEKTLDYMYDLDLTVNMYWRAVYATVENSEPVYSLKTNQLEKQGGVDQPEPARRRQLNETEEEEDLSGTIQTNLVRIRADFSEPQLVSRSHKDQIIIAINETLFAEELPGQVITFVQENKQEYYFDYQIPKLGQGSTILASENLAASTDNFLKSFFGANMLVSLLSAGMLQYLWGMIHALQIMVMAALFRLETPINADMIMIMIMKLCGLEFISTEDVVQDWFEFRETEAMFTEVTSTGDKISKWYDAGFDSSNFIILLGPIFFIPIIFSAALFVRTVFAKMTICCRDNCLTRRIRQRLDVLVIVVRFFLESCIEIGLSAMISLIMLDSSFFNHGWEILSNSLACVSIVALCLAPFFLRKLIKRHLATIETSSQKDPHQAAEESQYHSLFEYYKPNWPALKYQIYFFLRRYWIILVLTVMPGLKYAQIWSQIFSAMFMASYIGAVQPFVSKLSNRQELINELFVIVASYPLFTFTPWVWDEGRKIQVGWFLVNWIGFNIVFNITLFFCILIKQIIFKCRIYYALYKRRQHRLRLEQKKRKELAYKEELARRAKANNDELYKIFQLEKPGMHKGKQLTEIKYRSQQAKESQADAKPSIMANQQSQIELIVKRKPGQEESKNGNLKINAANIDKLVSFNDEDDDSPVFRGYEKNDDLKGSSQPKPQAENADPSDDESSQEINKEEDPNQKIDRLIEEGKYAEAHETCMELYGISVTKYQLDRKSPISFPSSNMMMTGLPQSKSLTEYVQGSLLLQNNDVRQAWDYQPAVAALEKQSVVVGMQSKRAVKGKKKKHQKKLRGHPGKSKVPAMTQIAQANSVPAEPSNGQVQDALAFVDQIILKEKTEKALQMQLLGVHLKGPIVDYRL